MAETQLFRSPSFKEKSAKASESNESANPPDTHSSWTREYYKDNQDVPRWHKRDGTLSFSSENDLSLRLEPNKAKLFLVEGLTENVIEVYRKLQPKVPSALLEYHKSNNIYSAIANTHNGENSFFAKWSRLVKQKTKHWDIANRIAKGTPYNIDTSVDPQKLRLDHEQYKQKPYVHRPYSPISDLDSGNPVSGGSFPGDSVPGGLASGGSVSHRITQYFSCFQARKGPGSPVSNELRHAATQCISCFWSCENSGFIGILIFDSTPKHIITTRQYKLWGKNDHEEIISEPCFSAEEYSSSRDRFISELEKCEKQGIQEFEPTLANIIVNMMRDDTSKMLPCLNEALDKIDISLSDDAILQKSLQTWRDRLGRWRIDLIHQTTSLTYMSEILQQHQVSSASGNTENVLSTSPVDDEARLANLKRELENTSQRVNSTFQALMSTMSIVESRKAIAEAETVSKLTSLAFFFIPLTFVASIFGMNIVEFNQKLKVWI